MFHQSRSQSEYTTIAFWGTFYIWLSMVIGETTQPRTAALHRD